MDEWQLAVDMTVACHWCLNRATGNGFTIRLLSDVLVCTRIYLSSLSLGTRVHGAFHCLWNNTDIFNVKYWSRTNRCRERKKNWNGYCSNYIIESIFADLIIILEKNTSYGGFIIKVRLHIMDIKFLII